MNNAHPFSQQELSNFIQEGRTILLKFRSAFSLTWSHGAQQIIATPLPHKASGLPFTMRGRICAVSPIEFEKMFQF